MSCCRNENFNSSYVTTLANTPKQISDRSLSKKLSHTSHRIPNISTPHNKKTEKNLIEKEFYDFDYVFNEEHDQQSIFHNSGVKNLLDISLNNIFVMDTIFCYGQTGSGKTYTMSGIEERSLATYDDNNYTLEFNENKDGIIPRSLNYIFDYLESPKNDIKCIKASFLEIYNDKVIDLLNPNNMMDEKLLIRQNDAGFYVANLLQLQVDNIHELMAIVAEGHRNRHKASHELNADSSRSHSIFTIYIEKLDYPNEITKINFVDLAGSENLKISKSIGIQAKETASINKSLFALGGVISALYDITKKKNHKIHVPYRDSILTKLLMDAFQASGGITIMIACISPILKSADESIRTLTYASRAKSIIKLKPAKIAHQKNDSSSHHHYDHDKIIELEKIIDDLQLKNEQLTTLILNAGLQIPSFLSSNHNMDHISLDHQYNNANINNLRTRSAMTLHPTTPTIYDRTSLSRDSISASGHIDFSKNVHELYHSLPNDHISIWNKNHHANNLNDDGYEIQHSNHSSLKKENEMLRKKISHLENIFLSPINSKKKKKRFCFFCFYTILC